MLALLTALALPFGGLLHVYSSAPSPNPLLRRLHQLLHRAANLLAALGWMAKLKTVVAFFQCAAVRAALTRTPGCTWVRTGAPAALLNVAIMNETERC